MIRMIDLPNFYYCVLMTFTYSWFCRDEDFRLKKEDTEENSEDSSEDDPEENTAGEQPWRATKR